MYCICILYEYGFSQFFYEIELLQSSMDKLQGDLKGLGQRLRSKQLSTSDTKTCLADVKAYEQTLQVRL